MTIEQNKSSENPSREGLKYPCPNCEEIFESNYDLDRHTNLEKIHNGQSISVSEESTVFFKEVRLLSPALDCNPNHNLVLTVPFTGIRTIEKMKGKQQVWEHLADIILCCVTDRPEMFEATQKNFLDRGWFARVPQPILEPRWSMESLSQFLYSTVPSVSPFGIYQKVKEKFDSYIDFGGNDAASVVCSVYTILTYFYFMFEHCPYLKLGGEKGSAKSKTGSVFNALAFNAIMSANHTPATIYRLAQDTRGCMIIDEGEDLAYKSEERAAYQQVILSGWQRNGFALRTDKDSMRPTKFSTYCPKIICSIAGLYDVLEDRSFEIILLRTLDTKISDRQPVLSSKEWEPIRDELYLLLMQKWRTVQDLLENVKNEFDLNGRFWNLSKPLLVIAKLIDSEGKSNLQGSVASFIKDQAKSKQGKEEGSLRFAIIQCLQIMLSSGKLDGANPDLEERIELGRLLELVRTNENDQPNPTTGKYSISSKRVSAILSNLKLYKDPKRDGEHGGYRFTVTLNQVRDTIKRMSVQETADAVNNNTEHSELTERTELTKQGVVNPDVQTSLVADAQKKTDRPSLGSSVGSGTSVSSVAKSSPERSSVEHSVSSVEDKSPSQVFQATWKKESDGTWMLHCEACSGSYSTDKPANLKKHQDDNCPGLTCFKCPGNDGKNAHFGFIGSLQKHLDKGHPKEASVS